MWKCAICDTEFDWEEDAFNFKKAVDIIDTYERLNPEHLVCLDCTKKLFDEFVRRQALKAE